MFDTLSKTLKWLNIPLGTWFNIPVQLHWTWTILFVIILCVSPSFALIYAGLFVMVLLHEFGHCIAAKHYNCFVRDIVLYPFGGAATMNIPRKPQHELVVALAGPFVNLLLLAPLWLLAGYHTVLGYWALANTALLVFNLLPAFPMDGGRVLRAVLSWSSGNHLRSTLIAARVGQCFCVLFGVVGLVTFNLMLAFIGLMIFGAAEGELEQVRRQTLGGGFDPQSPEDTRAESDRLLREIEERLSQQDRP